MGRPWPARGVEPGWAGPNGQGSSEQIVLKLALTEDRNGIVGATLLCRVGFASVTPQMPYADNEVALHVLSIRVDPKLAPNQP